ncbi:Mannose or cellobiose epimerase, N-acyl-D-glucosamine 2-epimerase family [Litoreibacter ascidiaceicola]|uniref:Mannose or cellobiose epimerase, N-acyl-D-glucosamine 2-epimerase family n=1 Tax=Litoreibacter ascidiaceicola TaxID=1486859 RepID=A0A1M5DLW5_9RHOB|nr:AGE family epimerase/isomerase [Litoreibacter ascidiaceicola]SHF65337.1 Mannose or cellobiose epimerase, N-acyl-D-glucosamine 2-epimerase family [Litoreibacter ascidiaceicola]SHF67891.1 Mannose or cellobiose epimerase, N-acyl-D-glucosamine 2-epimerase family [Litoreibacter ascidiaceicola]
MTTNPAYPDFESVSFLNDHISKTLAFYEDRAVDPDGGFFHCFEDDGRIYDSELRHLVSSCRFVFNYALAFRKRGAQQHRDKALHGLEFLENTHRQDNGAYAWQLRNGKVTHGEVMAYGHAFVMIASATALEAGIAEARPTLNHIWNFMETQFWQPDHGAYADERNADLSDLSPYRGQNANMHSCEGCIAAFRATGETRYLDRAEALAYKFTMELSDKTGGLIWEHYDANWAPDHDYHKDKPNDLFKPWGIQPGHLVEWARLLLTLDQIRPQKWYLVRAIALFGAAMEHGRDQELGGLIYGFAPNGTPCAREKYYWVNSEAAATAWRLFQRTGEETYRQNYHEIWCYAWDHLIDHEHGAWFRVLTPEGNKIDNQKSPPGKTDYHTLGVCWDILSAKA